MSILFESTGYKTYNKNIVKGNGCYIYDDTGRKYLDLEAGVWALPLGHCDSDINNAMHQQIDQLIHCGYKYSQPIVESCAHELLSISGLSDGRCVFLSSGSEAVEYAVQLAKSIRPTKKCICLKNQYLSAYGNCLNKSDQDWELVDWNFSEDKSVNQYYHDLSSKINFSKVGVFVFEPGNSSGLVKLPPQNMVKALNIICEENNVVIVVDEVTTGMGRTGKWFGYMHYDIKPHIIAIGKGLGNGYPVSSVVIQEKTAKEAEKTNFHYAQSHQNDPLGCRVAYEVITKIKRNQLLKHTNEISVYIKRKYEELQQEIHSISQVRGVGLLLSMELSHDTSSDAMIGIEKGLFEKGFVVGIKVSERIIRTYCPLIITKEMIDEYIAALKSVLLDMSV